MDINTAFETLENLDQGISDKEIAKEAVLAEIANTVGKTFERDGQFYQIVKRFIKDKNRDVLLLKKLPGSPKTWLKGRPKKETVVAVAEETTSTEEGNQDDVVVVE